MFKDFNSRHGHATIAADILAALASVEQKHGVKFSAAGGSLGASEMTVKVKVISADVNAVEDAAKADFARNCRFYNLEPEDFGAIFECNGTRYKLTGIRQSRPKYPIDGESQRDGRTFKFTRSVLTKIIADRPARQQAAAKVAASIPEVPMFASAAQF